MLLKWTLEKANRNHSVYVYAYTTQNAKTVCIYVILVIFKESQPSVESRDAKWINNSIYKRVFLDYNNNRAVSHALD